MQPHQQRSCIYSVRLGMREKQSARNNEGERARGDRQEGKRGMNTRMSLSARRRLEVSTWSRVISRANRAGSTLLERSRSRSCRCCHMAARRVLRAWRAFRGGTCVVGCSLTPSSGVEGVRTSGKERGLAARLGSVDFASHRGRLASGLPHGLVLAPGAQGGLCGGALTGERL